MCDWNHINDLVQYNKINPIGILEKPYPKKIRRMKNTGIESQIELSDSSGMPLEKFLFTSFKICREKVTSLAIMEKETSM